MRTNPRSAFGLLTGLALGATLLVGGCERDQPSFDQAKEALEKVSETAESVSNLLDGLDETKVGELAKVVSRIEKNPEEAQELLKEYGIDAKQLEEALYEIARDPELRKLFAELKEAAE